MLAVGNDPSAAAQGVTGQGRIPDMVMISERPAEIETGPCPATGKAI